MNSEPIPHSLDPREQDAWLAFIDDTQPDREAYTQAIEAAATSRDLDLGLLDAATKTARHQVWERYNAAITDAWKAYMSATESARLRRESETYLHTPLAVEQ